MSRQQRPFIDYLNEVDAILEKKFGITSSDVDMEGIAAAQEAGDTAVEHAAWLGEQHNNTSNNRRNSCETN